MWGKCPYTCTFSYVAETQVTAELWNDLQGQNCRFNPVIGHRLTKSPASVEENLV